MIDKCKKKSIQGPKGANKNKASGTETEPKSKNEQSDLIELYQKQILSELSTPFSSFHVIQTLHASEWATDIGEAKKLITNAQSICRKLPKVLSIKTLIKKLTCVEGKFLLNARAPTGYSITPPPKGPGSENGFKIVILR